MASSSNFKAASRLHALVFFLVWLLPLASGTTNDSCFSAIFSFGDSLTDTGNLLHDHRKDSTIGVGRFPYGKTYFKRPTGRFSDGRLIIDFISQAMRHQLLPAYLVDQPKSWEDINTGMNFAVAGATALNSSFFAEQGIHSLVTNHSLSVQIEWIKGLQRFPTFSPTEQGTKCKRTFSNSLILMGEIGGNDYNYAFFQGKAQSEVESYVLNVVQSIGTAINELIEMGARVFLVPGNFPLGCNSAYLTAFPSDRDDDYSDIGCLNRLNNFAVYHNTALQAELRRLKKLHPEATLIYADYYGAAMSLFKSGGGSDNNLAACCGGGGPYNYNPSVACGAKNSVLCDDPSKYINWDGFHLTEAAYQRIADGILLGPYASPPLLSACTLSQ